MGRKEAPQAVLRIEVLQFGAVAEVDQNRVSTPILPGGDYQWSAILPLGNQGRNDGWRNRRVVGWSD